MSGIETAVLLLAGSLCVFIGWITPAVADRIRNGPRGRNK